MVTVTVEEAKTSLSDLIKKVLFGEEVYIFLSGEETIKLTKVKKKLPRKAGCLNGLIKIKEGFNEIPKGFESYIP
ncbi:MAG: hypothetical protein KDK90_13285 [Leptospiraceae bacterium]|nr:hypothetical protein [Leptospiraceae bacterium]